MRYRGVIAVCAVMLMVGGAPVVGQQEQGDEAAAMEAWQKASTPGEVHAFLAKKAGEWKIVTKMWMQPDTPPMESTGSGTVEMVLGGRYLMEKMSGTAMGMPFEGMGITGYDNMTGVVTMVWYDNMGTMTLIATGEYEKPGLPVGVSGTMLDPMSGMEVKVRMVTTIISDDASKFEYFVTPPGDAPEMLTMVLEYTRAE